MSVGVWMAPVVLIGLSVMLWTAAWLDRLSAGPDLGPELERPEAVDASFIDTELDRPVV
jgi:hypothetical protein